jgi:hypothetical protein
VRSDWFDPRRSAAHYVVLFPGIPGYPGFTNRRAVTATFGRPASVYHVGRYTIWYWPGNLLTRLRPAQATVPGSRRGFAATPRGELRAGSTSRVPSSY